MSMFARGGGGVCVWVCVGVWVEVRGGGGVCAWEWLCVWVGAGEGVEEEEE